MRPSRTRHAAALIAAGLVVAGFVLLFLGWQGGAATLFVPTQVAYGVSGGVVGVALIGTGGAVAFAHVTRLATARRSQQLQRVIGDSVEVLVALRDRTANGTRGLQVPVPAGRPAIDAATTVPVPAASNGHGPLPG